MGGLLDVGVTVKKEVGFEGGLLLDTAGQKVGVKRSVAAKVSVEFHR